MPCKAMKRPHGPVKKAKSKLLETAVYERYPNRTGSNSYINFSRKQALLSHSCLCKLGHSDTLPPCSFPDIASAIVVVSNVSPD